MGLDQRRHGRSKGAFRALLRGIRDYGSSEQRLEGGSRKKERRGAEKTYLHADEFVPAVLLSNVVEHLKFPCCHLYIMLVSAMKLNSRGVG